MNSSPPIGDISNCPKVPQGKRVFVDFEGAMTASTVWINGVLLGEYKGGFTPFSFELTKHLHPQNENVLTVQLDSTERSDIPPFGYEIDYMTFGGIYREVSLRVVPELYIDNIFAQPKDVMSGNPSLDVNCFLAGDLRGRRLISLEAELRNGDKIISKISRTIERPSSAIDSSSPHPTRSLHRRPCLHHRRNAQDPARYTVSLMHLGGYTTLESRSAPSLHGPRASSPRLARLSMKTRGA